MIRTALVVTPNRRKSVVAASATTSPRWSRQPSIARGDRRPEAAVNRRVDDDQRRDGLEEQLQAYGSDRSKLASELDALRARSADLEAANREVSRRLDHAMGTIRAALELREH